MCFQLRKLNDKHVEIHIWHKIVSRTLAKFYLQWLHMLSMSDRHKWCRCDVQREKSGEITDVENWKLRYTQSIHFHIKIEVNKKKNEMKPMKTLMWNNIMTWIDIDCNHLAKVEHTFLRWALFLWFSHIGQFKHVR